MRHVRVLVRFPAGIESSRGDLNVEALQADGAEMQRRSQEPHHAGARVEPIDGDERRDIRSRVMSQRQAGSAHPWSGPYGHVERLESDLAGKTLVQRLDHPVADVGCGAHCPHG